MHFLYVTPTYATRASQSTEVTLDLPPPGAPMGTSNMFHEERRKKMENKQACTKKKHTKMKQSNNFFFFLSPFGINCTFPIPTSNYLCPPQTPLLSIYVCRLQRICRHRCAAHSSRRYRRMCWVRHFIIFFFMTQTIKPLTLCCCARGLSQYWWNCFTLRIVDRKQNGSQLVAWIILHMFFLAFFLSIYLFYIYIFSILSSLTRAVFACDADATSLRHQVLHEHRGKCRGRFWEGPEVRVQRTEIYL